MERMRNNALSVLESLSQSELLRGTASTAEWQLPDVPEVTGTIEAERIEEIMPTMLQGVIEMRPQILSGTYTAIVGDDTSGRIPSLILRGVLNHAAVIHQRPSVPAFFLKGKRDEFGAYIKDNLQRRLQRYQPEDHPGKLLLVTEFIASGNHIKNIGKALQDIALPYDVFAVNRSSNEDHYREIGVLPETSFLYPQKVQANIGTNLHDAVWLSGYDYVGGRVIPVPNYRKQFLSARKDVEVAVSRLVQEGLLRK